MTKKQIDGIVSSVTDNFRTFGGGKYNANSNNPIAYALKDEKAQFAAGVDVKEVVLHVLKLAKKKSFTQPTKPQRT